jgi:5-methylcytosine-specific restriction endonuclease McrA
VRTGECTECGEPFTTTATRGPVSPYCDSCRPSAQKRKRSAYRKENRDRLAASTKKWREGTKDERRAYEVARRQRPERKIYMDALRAELRDEFRQRDAEYYQRNRTAYRARDARRRERRAAGPGVTDKDWRRVLLHHRGSGDGGACCWACGRYEQFPEMDHLIPLSRGGQHRIGNVAPACTSCNGERNNRLIVE